MHFKTCAFHNLCRCYLHKEYIKLEKKKRTPGGLPSKLVLLSTILALFIILLLHLSLSGFSCLLMVDGTAPTSQNLHDNWGKECKTLRAGPCPRRKLNQCYYHDFIHRKKNQKRTWQVHRGFSSSWIIYHFNFPPFSQEEKKVTHGFYIEHFHTFPAQPIPGVPAYTFSGGFYSDFKSWLRLDKARLVWPVSRHLISLGCCRKERFLNIGKVFLNKTSGPGGRMEGGRKKRELRSPKKKLILFLLGLHSCARTRFSCGEQGGRSLLCAASHCRGSVCHRTQFLGPWASAVGSTWSQ